MIGNMFWFWCPGAIALLILQLLIAISGFSANCLVVIATFTKFSCKKASNLFVCTLAIIDSLSLLGDFVGLGIQGCEVEKIKQKNKFSLGDNSYQVETVTTHINQN